MESEAAAEDEQGEIDEEEEAMFDDEEIYRVTIDVTKKDQVCVV